MGVEERYNKKKEEEKKTLYNGVENRYMSKNIDTISSEINSRLNTWFENNNNYISNFQDRFSKVTGSYTDPYDSGISDWVSTVTAQKNNFDTEADSIKTMLETYKGYLDEEWVNTTISNLEKASKVQSDIVNTSNEYLKYWSQWDSEEDYNQWYEQNKAYFDVLNAEDFEHYSQLGASIKNPTLSEAEGVANIFGWRPGAKDVGNIVTYSRDNLAAIVMGNNMVGDARYSRMTDNEVNVYNYYLAKYGEEKAAEFLSSIDEELTKRYENDILTSMKEWAVDSPVIASAHSAFTSLGSSAEYIKDIVTGDDRNHLADISSTIRGTVSEEVDWEIGNWDAFDFLYNTGMSMVDSASSMALFGQAGGAVLGLSAAAQATNDALDRGLPKEKVFWNGIMSGVFECLFETVSIGQFEALKEGVSTSVKELAKNIGKSMLVNASEETLTEIANITYDLIANADLSNYEINVRYYMEQGMSETEAKRKAALDLGAQVVEAGASGALMGFGFGAIGGGFQMYNAETAGSVYKGSEQELISESLEIDPGNKLATQLKSKLESGKTISGANLYTLAQQNETTIRANDVASIQSAAENRLTELGERGNVKAIAAALTKQAQGERLTFTERETIKSSTFGQRVANELNTENIKSGEYSTSWSESIGTDRINADEYSRLLRNEVDTNAPTKSAITTNPETAQTPETATIRNSRTVETTEPTEENAQASTEETQETAQQAKTITETESASANENATETATTAPESAEKNTVALEKASKQYGAQASDMVSTYIEGQDVVEYDAAYRAAYDMGNSGVNLSYAMNSNLTGYLTKNQRKLAYAAGADASAATAREQDAANKAKSNGNTGRRKGTVMGDGVTIADIKTAFNDTQGTAYKLLSTYAEATGIDIVLYKSTANENGVFEGAQGKFKWSENTIYIDVNAGLANIKDVDKLAKYTMMRTFAHEFTHFIEKWNPIQYNEFRKVVFDTLTERGENVDVLITTKMDQSEGITYSEASREVIAEAMTDILPDANFVEELATNHKTVFNKLLEKLKEFVSELKAYFNSLLSNRSREANALKEKVGESVKYVENIVKLFDKVAVEAVENYQATVATETETENNDGGIENAEQQPEQRTDNEGRTDKTSAGSNEKALSKAGDGRGISEEVGRDIQNLEQDLHLRGGQRGITQTRFSEDSFINPKKESVEAEEYAKLSEYGIEGYVVKKSAWDRSVQAFSRDGRIYMREGMDEIYRGTVVSHEATHVMNQLQYQPYLDFLDRTPVMLDMASVYAQSLMNGPAEHYNIDISADEKQLTRIYDEINATIYGSYVAGQIVGEIKDKVKNAFYNFDAYINELAGIHEQFKKENAPKEEVKTQGKQTEVSGDSFIITDNAEYGTLEIKFDDKPSEAVRDVLKAHKFRWHRTKGVWYGKSERADIVRALREVYQQEQSNIEVTKPSEEINETAENTKEVKPNVENVDNRSTVSQPDTDRQGDTSVLDGLQADDVQGDAQRGNPVGNSIERGQETGRDDNRTDAERAGGRPSEGDSKSGDIRRDGGAGGRTRGDGTGQTLERTVGNLHGDEASSRGSELDTERGESVNEETTVTAEKLHEDVVEQIAQQSTEQPKGRNFVIGESLDLPNGEKSRYKANVEAIKLVKQLESEKRYATETEQIILSKYVGWGGLANAFDQRKTDWAKEYAELKELLTEEEYASARGSTLNAHFTDISVIKAMYDGLSALGFNGGRMLEPSSGVGNFVGAMPAAMTAKVKSWTMVELDGITGLIAKYLYPNADVRIQGFEKANIPDNYMDVAISNVPFGNYAITDKAYPKKVTSAIHNYFFAKSLDKVRPGGIVMFITSSYTMNSKEDTVRRYIMQRADLLGAIRLPDSAFKGNAGTEVVTDILILKKRAANTAYAGEDFLESPYKYISGYNGAYINSYFDNHPEMVLGTASMGGGMYRGNSLTYKALEGKGSLADQIREAFSHIKGKMEYPATLSREKTNFAVERANKKTKENGLVVKDGKVYQNKNGEFVEVNTSKGAAERISGMLEIRDAARDLMNYQQQGLNDTEIKKARTKLNKVYDAFVNKYGFINSQTNKSAINEDPDRYSIYALENWNAETKKATKADIFSKNTIAPNRTVTSAKDVSEGLIVSVNQTGGVDTALIAKLTGKTEADVTRELIDSRQAFKNRNGELEPAEVYLSGNVRAKLRDAEALVPLDSDYTNNVEALKSVMPEDVGYQDIFVNPGTPWIPNSVYSDFAAYMLGTRNTDWRKDVDITRNAETGNFTVELIGRYLKNNAANTQKWGTPRRTFIELFDAMLNSKSVVIKDKLDDGSFVINKDATAAANEKIENIQKEFQEWLWKDEARRTELATLYNETFNSIVTPKYNGDNLTVNGANALKPLRAHQRNAVQRIISSGGNTLLAHKVGAGKTYEMAAAAMKLKELGLIKKPMFAVPKSLVAQWGVEFMDFFPTAKLLVAEAGDFTASNRKVFMNRIANGEYDAVIVSYEQFEKLPISNDFARSLYQEQIDSIIAAIEEAKAEKGGKSLSVKDLEKKRKSLQTKIDKLTDNAKDEDNIDFEQLGVDSLFVDEAHNFKNLFYTTSMTNVSGLGNKDGSKRAFDLYTKVRYLQQLNGGRGIVFATATPVMNSMSEMYIMQKYLQPDLLNQLGLSTFDAWAKQFGEVVNGVEIKPSGQGYRVKQSFSRFKNMSELQLLFRNFADVLTDIPGLKIPKMKGGKVNVVLCESGEFQQNFMKELEKRADNIKNVDPSVDNMLKITSDGRKISYTQRMIDPSLPYEEGCKLFRCADNVIKEYNDSKSIKGTQLIFCDMATPKGKSDNNTETVDIEMDMESTQLYDDLKARLRQGGIPAKEIAFIHDADTDQKKKKLFADVNDGKVRVLIGSTGKMGVGMNAQKRVVAIHHLDAPWRPGDVEQRDGRAFRQGNINEEVTKYTYVTEGSFDARLWDILDRKQTFINQIMNGESVGREAEDTGEVTLSAAEVKALASGSPLIMEQVQLDTDIKKLESLYRAHVSSIRSAKERLMRDNGKIAELERLVESGKADVTATVDTYSDKNFAITVGKAKYTDKKEAGTALMAEITSKVVDSGYTTVGSFAGFKLRVTKTKEGITGLLTGKQDYPFKTYPSNTTFMINHLIATVESISEKVKLWEHTIAETQADIIEQKKLIATPFAKQEELDQKRSRYNEVMAILNPKEEQSLDSVDEDKVQEQSRAYQEDDTRVQYQLRPVPPVQPTTDGWKRTKDTDEAKSVFPNMWNIAAEESETRNPTQIASTVGTYRKIYDILEKEGFTGKILDASSGLGIGTQVGRDEYGFDVEDIEPYPGNGYIPMYTDYSALGKKYDVIISSAVLNVLPQDQRDALVVKMGEMLNEGGRMFITTRGKDVETLAKTGKNIHLGEMEWIETVKGSYQKGFTNPELILYLRDALGENFSVVPASRETGGKFNNNTNVVVTKLSDGVQYQQRTTTLTDREVLAIAADKLAESNLPEAERDALRIFQNRLAKLETLQEERVEAGRLYKEQQFTAPVNREAAEQTRNRMTVLDEQIKAADADVLSLENKKVFGEVLKKARKVVETEQRSHDAETFKRYIDRRKESTAIKKYRERIRIDVNELTGWVLKPNNKDIVKHIPDVLKNSVIPFLSSIDFTSKQQLRGGEATKADKEFVKRLNGLKSALKQNIDVNGLYSGYNDLPPNFMDKLQTLIDAVQAITDKKSGEFVINQMTSEELKDLSDVVRVIKAYITQINKFHANAMFQHVYEAGDSTIDALSVMESDNGKSNKASYFVFWQQIRPAFAFERFGSGGKAIYDGLRRGQAQLAFNTKKIVEFTEKAYTEAEVTAWEKEIKQIKLDGDVVVKMPVSMIMSFYELSKQPDSLRHMLGEGFRVATYTNKGKKISDNGHTLTAENISTIVNELTPRQKEVADALQKYMAEQGGAWGNYVSVKRFGEELFTNEQYFPINSDGRHLQATADEQPSAASLYALLNMSFTKSRNELANNRIVVYSIFDVFSNHMASMAQYNAMALPVLDAIKWFNYQQKTEDHDGNKYVKDGVREQMARVYGVSEEMKPGAGNKGYAESFVLNILKAFNGTEAQGVPTDSTGMNALRNFNMAQVAYNFRVVVQQPLAITRAALLVDYSSIIKGMNLKPSAIKQNIAEMQKYSGIAAWKSLGFYDVNISRGLSDTIKHSSDWKQKVGEFGMKGAEMADTITWAAMWSACKEEVIKKQGLTPKNEGFYEAVTELFEEVIYKTQVVDSILTKNEFLRSKGLFARLTGSFMSESTTTASMLIDAFDKYNTDLKKGLTRQQAWEKNKRMIVRTAYVYGVSAVVLAAVQAVADAMRDDDDYETFIEKWLEAFGGNLVDEIMPFNKLPLLSDFYDLAKELASIFGVDTYGNPPQSVFMQWYDSLVKGVEILYDKISGKDIDYTWYGGAYKLLQAAAGMTGLPMATAVREIITAWNNIVGAMAPSLKVKTYEPSEQSEIKYAYKDGYLTFDEAVNELIEKGLVDNEDEAYFTVQGWEKGEGYSRYDALENAIRNGTGVDTAMDELISHGYTEDEIYSVIKSKAGKWYKDGEISKAQATDILEKYTDMDSDEITKQINKWSSVVVTGIEYDDIGEEYLKGNITASRAVEMFMRYGGETEEDAKKKVAVLDFKKAHAEFEDEAISYAFVSAYTEYCEPQGIDTEVFYDVWKYSSTVTGDKDENGETIRNSKKDKVLAYVDSMELSIKQKDALYYALGYAESNLRDAPWR